MLRSVLDDLIGFSPETSDVDVAARQLIETSGYAAAAATLLPIPGTELVVVMPIHVGMVVGLSRLYGTELSESSATELILRIGATVGASLFTTRAVTTVAKIALPGLGGLISAPMIFATTIAIGAVVCVFFQREGELSAAEMRKIYRAAARGARRGFDPARARAAEKTQTAAPEPEAPAPPPEAPLDPVARLRRLKRLYESGLIDEDEHAAAREQILQQL